MINDFCKYKCSLCSPLNWLPFASYPCHMYKVHKQIYDQIKNERWTKISMLPLNLHLHQPMIHYWSHCISDKKVHKQRFMKKMKVYKENEKYHVANPI